MKAYERPWKPYLRRWLCVAICWLMAYVWFAGGMDRWKLVSKQAISVVAGR